MRVFVVVNKKVKLYVDGEKVECVLEFDEIDYKTTKDMIIKNHYSKKWNTSFGKINIGVFKDGVLLGVASFGNLMNPKSYKKINSSFKQENVIELNRLWVDDVLGKNVESVLLGASWKILRDKYPHIKAVQSFADGRLGCGTIYKATNFKYFGYSESIFFEHVETGETYHKVPLENTARPKGLVEKNAMWVEKKLKPFVVKTYRYIYLLYKDVKIEMREQKYPEYEIGFTYLEKYDHRKSNIIRAYILSYLLNYEREYQILNEWAKENINVFDISSEMDNKSIVEISKTRAIDKYKELVLKPERIFKNSINEQLSFGL